MSAMNANGLTFRQWLNAAGIPFIQYVNYYLPERTRLMADWNNGVDPSDERAEREKKARKR